MNRYKNTRRKIVEIPSQYKDRKGNISSFSTTIYKEVEEKNSDMFVITQEGDRLDILANAYYGTPTLWWFLARANNLKTMNVTPGTSLRIPSSAEDAIGL